MLFRESKLCFVQAPLAFPASLQTRSKLMKPETSLLQPETTLLAPQTRNNIAKQQEELVIHKPYGVKKPYGVIIHKPYGVKK